MDPALILSIQAPGASPGTPARWEKPARIAGGTWWHPESPGSRRGLLWSWLSAALAGLALTCGGCSSQPASQYPQADVDAPENWLPVSVEEFNKECPDFSKALAAGTLKFPDPHTALVASMGMVNFKVRIEKGVIKQAWRERPAE